VHNARHAYYAMISYVDDKIGRLLDVLARSGLADDTLVVFTSDHGEMMGERGMWFKQCFFEGAVRVPLVIAGAGWSGAARVGEIVSLVDLMPTLLDVAGVDPAEAAGRLGPLHGASLVPLAEGRPHGHVPVAISEYSDMGVCAPCRMVREGSLKYLYTHGHPAQLYDLATDADELNDRVGDPAYAEAGARLRARLLADWNPDRIAERVLRSQAERQLIHGVTSGGKKTHNWSFMARPDDDRRFVRSGGDAEGTVATKGRARYPYVPPTEPDRAGD
jgi:choline-sulfatase